MAEIKFPEGKFYACNDPETLMHTEPEEAIEEYLDDNAERDEDVVAQIRRLGSITVTAYKPKEIPDAEIDRWADRCLEHLMEDFSEEHANPDDDLGEGFPPDAEATMREAVRKIIRATRVWSCASVGSVTLDAAQIEEVMREYHPHWFEEPGAVGSVVP